MKEKSPVGSTGLEVCAAPLLETSVSVEEEKDVSSCCWEDEEDDDEEDEVGDSEVVSGDVVDCADVDAGFEARPRSERSVVLLREGRRIVGRSGLLRFIW